MANETFLYLTTTGHITGNPHTIEIWYTEHNGYFYLIAETGEKAHWVQNIQHNPTVRFRIGKRTATADDPQYMGTGRIVDRNSETQLVAAIADLMNAKYSWSKGLIVELRPESVD